MTILEKVSKLDWHRISELLAIIEECNSFIR